MPRTRRSGGFTPDQEAAIHAIHTGVPIAEVAPHETLNLQQVPVAALHPSERNARRRVDHERLKELADSIRVHGVLEPLIVRPAKDGFEIVAGERRYRAAALAGRETVPVLVCALSDEETLELALIENLQRADLDPLEQARGFMALMTANPTRFTVRTIAARLALSEHWVADRLSLLHLVPEAQRQLDEGAITPSHGIALAKLKADDQARALEDGVFEPEWPTLDLDGTKRRKAVSVRELDAWIARHVRFDATHAAIVAPLEFGETAETLERAHKTALDVVAITHDPSVSADVRADGAPRIYVAGTWKPADGHDGSKICDHSVLGVFAIGPDYGQTRTVCVNPACNTHWKKERLARQRETKERKERREDQTARTATTRTATDRTEAARTQWRTAVPALVDAVRASLRTAPIKRVLAILDRDRDVKLPTTADAAVRLLAWVQLRNEINRFDAHATVPALLKPLGVNTTAIVRAAQKGRS